MWGFLKCNYSYTKILIVLLFSLSCLFFFQGRVIPACWACLGSARGRAQEEARRSWLLLASRRRDRVWEQPVVPGFHSQPCAPATDDNRVQTGKISHAPATLSRGLWVPADAARSRRDAPGCPLSRAILPCSKVWPDYWLLFLSVVKCT